MEVNIPVGSAAEIIVPKPDSGKCTLAESGIHLNSGKGKFPAGVGNVSEKTDSFVIEAGAGKYAFIACLT